MRIPIPNDWNEEDWLCIQVQWPDSPQWVGILSGLITSIMRGRLWDENTGLIKDVQAIGEQIYDANFPFQDCGGGGPVDNGDAGGGDDTINFAMAVCNAIEKGFDVMTLCGYNPKAFRFDGTTLWVKDFCGDWVEVGSADNEATNPPTGGYDFDDPAGNLSPCGKAQSLADALIDVAGYFWDNSDNSFFPIIEIQAQNATGIELKSTYASELWALTLAHKGLRAGTTGIVPLDRDNVLPEDLLERFTCLMYEGMSQDDFETDGDYIDKLVENAIGTTFPPVDVDNVAAQAWWYVVKAMVGKAKMVELANAGAYDTTADCLDCQTVIIPQPNLTGPVYWQNSYTVVLESQGATLETRQITSAYTLEATYASAQNANFAEVHGKFALAHPVGTIGELEITVYNRAQSTKGDYFPAANWSDTTPTLESNYTHPTIDNVATPDTIQYITSPNKLVCVYKWDTPVSVDLSSFFFATKINPKDNVAQAQRYYVNMDITYSGAQR